MTTCDSVGRPSSLFGYAEANKGPWGYPWSFFPHYLQRWYVHIYFVWIVWVVAWRLGTFVEKRMRLVVEIRGIVLGGDAVVEI